MIGGVKSAVSGLSVQVPVCEVTTELAGYASGKAAASADQMDGAGRRSRGVEERAVVGLKRA